MERFAPKGALAHDGEIYLPMKKIGKNNPKEAEIKAANVRREDWNRMADAHNEEVRRQKQLTGKKKTYDMLL